MRRLRPGVGAVRAAVAPSREFWDESNAASGTRPGPLWVALGDSTAQGIGASSPDRGYVGQLRRRLEARDREPWRLLNLSRSGARIRDLLREQLPRLTGLPEAPALVTCAAGANDVAWRPGVRRAVRDVEVLLRELPAGAVVATLPRGLPAARAEAVNAVIRRAAAARGLVVADVWGRTGPPWRGKLAADEFHPNDRGYQDWADAFGDALGLSDIVADEEPGGSPS